MVTVGKKKKEPAAGAKKRNVIFVTLDDVTEAALQVFIDRQRVKPDRAAVALTALVEFLQREGHLPKPDGK